MTLRTFANGEVYCRYEESVAAPTCHRSAHVFQHGHGVKGQRRSMEVLMVMIDAARRRVGPPGESRDAPGIRVLTPGQEVRRSGSHQRSAGARMLEAGDRTIVTRDVHSGQIQGSSSKPCEPHDRHVHVTRTSPTWGGEPGGRRP